MASVSELVKQKEKDIEQSYIDSERKEKRRRRARQTQLFGEEVQDVIRRFENRIFDIKATKKKVADFIVDWTPRGAERSFGTRSLSYADDYFYSLKFEKGESAGNTLITRSKVYNKWKAALEKKFGIEIIISRDYEYKRRFGNSGYETYPDKIYQGLRAWVYPK